MDESRDSLRVAVDIGGTFTDLIALSADGSVYTQKVLSTPEDFSRGILEVLQLLLGRLSLPARAVESLFHATTVATNAIVENRGARTALITTRGFRDVLELRRIRIPELYNFFLDKPPPMVPRRLRFEVNERIDACGQVIVPLDEADLEEVLGAIAKADAEAVAICLIHSYAHPGHEKTIACRAVERLPDSVFVTCSSEIVPEIREYERMSTVVINASVGPIVRDYLGSLINRLKAAGISVPLQIMMSNGGLMGAGTARSRPAAMVESGPAAGVIGAAHVARLCGLANVITLDMGGTTAKAGIIEDGLIARTSEYEVGSGINVSSRLVKGRGHALKLPVIDLSEIGAGGGSIAAVDKAGVLHVGPHSAGAEPGPACYDRGGTEATLTDAMVALGYLNPEVIAGGQLRIDQGKARAAIAEKVAKPLGKSVEEAAFGVLVLAGAAMTRAVKAVSTYRGRDPRDFVLIAFGGNGPMVAAQIADELSMGRILVPRRAGVFSAFGLIVGNAEHEFSQALIRSANAMQAEELAAVFEKLSDKAADVLTGEGHDVGDAVIRHFADLRYSGQAYELTVSVDDWPLSEESVAMVVNRFHDAHEATYGHASKGEPVDFISLRLQAVIARKTRSEPVYDQSVDDALPERPETGRTGYFGPAIGTRPVAVICRRHLTDQPRQGPLIVEEYDSTCLVPPGWSAAVDLWGNIVLERAP